MVAQVLHHMSSKNAAIKMVGSVAADRLERGGHFDHWTCEAKAFEIYLSQLTAQL